MMGLTPNGRPELVATVLPPGIAHLSDECSALGSPGYGVIAVRWQRVMNGLIGVGSIRPATSKIPETAVGPARDVPGGGAPAWPGGAW